MKPKTSRRRAPAPKPILPPGAPAETPLILLENSRACCSGIADAFSARIEERRKSNSDLKGERDFAGEASGNDAAHQITMFMAFIPAASLAELLIKARAARRYVECTDDKLPDNPLDRLWLSIAEDIEHLCGEAGGTP
jgi:hypothetical protein